MKMIEVPESWLKELCELTKGFDSNFQYTRETHELIGYAKSAKGLLK